MTKPLTKLDYNLPFCQQWQFLDQLEVKPDEIKPGPDLEVNQWLVMTYPDGRVNIWVEFWNGGELMEMEIKDTIVFEAMKEAGYFNDYHVWEEATTPHHRYITHDILKRNADHSFSEKSHTVPVSDYLQNFIGDFLDIMVPVAFDRYMCGEMDGIWINEVCEDDLQNVNL